METLNELLNFFGNPGLDQHRLLQGSWPAYRMGWDCPVDWSDRPLELLLTLLVEELQKASSDTQDGAGVQTVQDSFPLCFRESAKIGVNLRIPAFCFSPPPRKPLRVTRRRGEFRTTADQRKPSSFAPLGSSGTAQRSIPTGSTPLPLSSQLSA